MEAGFPWLRPRAEGLFCAPGGFFIDPRRAVELAVISHAHSDHARTGHGRVIATPETLALMRARLGERAVRGAVALACGERMRLGEVDLTLVPAGHVLGSAQIVMEHGGARAVVSGDFKRAPDPTCAPFAPVGCDLFVTEATFALPVWRMPPAAREVGKLLASLEVFPRRTHLIGCYGIGKVQRLIALLRAAGWGAPVWVHPAFLPPCAVYAGAGIELGELRPFTGEAPAGALVLAPPGTPAPAADAVLGMASGWMRLSRHASGVELPLILSDHADWDELLATIAETGAREVWITHGSDAALAPALRARGVRAMAMSALR